MSRYPPQGYPPPYPPQQYYHNPDHPIPYRGPSMTDLRSPTTLSHTSTSKEGEEDAETAEDGGWDADGPLMKERRARAGKGRGHSRGMNSLDKTAIWLRTSQSGPATKPEQPLPAKGTTLSASKPPKIPSSRKKVPAEVPQRVETEIATGSEVKSEATAQIHGDEPQIGPDGWYVDVESAATAERQSQEGSLATSVKSEIASTSDGQSEGNVEPPSEISPIEPLDSPEVHSEDAGMSPIDSQNTIQVPPPPVPQAYVYRQQPPRGLQPSWHDPNVLDVVNPRRWGAGQAALVSEEALAGNRQVGGENIDHAWAADETLVEWREQVSQQSHSQEVEESSTTTYTSPALEDDIPDRPNSIPPIPPAVTAYISSESSAASTPKPSEDLEREATPPLVRDTPSPTEGEEPLPTPTGPSGRRPSIAHVELDGQIARSPPRAQRPGRRFGPGSGGPWWKREPHPAYSAEFSARRLLVSFPFPIRLDRVRPIMSDHFSKYGSIRFIQPREVSSDAASQAVVVFWTLESVDACLTDPNRHDCISRSYPTSSRFEIRIEDFPSQTSTIYIKMSGPRCDSRSRSASPPSRGKAGTPENWENTKTIPPYITIWGMPEFNRWRNRVEWRAYVVQGDEPDEMIMREAVMETRNEPTLIERIELNRRVPQKLIVPKLCDFFAEIVSVESPRHSSHGWLVTISGQRDGERLMSELQKIDGFTARWATSTDNQDTPVSRRGSRNSLRQKTNSPHGHIHHEIPTAPVSLADPSDPIPLSPLSARSLPSEYPGLTKTLAPTYRGRLLKEERVDGGSRFVDECAIFVGRLVKEVETEMSLFQRFAKYGRICGIEYNPKNHPNTYGTARILYGDRASADRALHHEGQAVSHGSGLKVEVRRVLPHDVDMREMYIDEFGRPVSPSMAAQYSPPHEHMVPTYPLPPVVPYPPPGGPTSPPFTSHAGQFPQPLPMPPQHMPHPNFFPVYFGHPGSTGMPPPPPEGGFLGLSKPPMWYAGPEGAIPPVAQQQGQNVGYVPIYPTLPTQGQAPNIVTSSDPIGKSQKEEIMAPSTEMFKAHSRSPSLPSVPSQTSINPESSVSSASASVSGTGSGGSGLRAVSLREEHGVLKPEYDPEELRQWQEENGYPVTQEVAKTDAESSVADPSEIARPQTSPIMPRDQPQLGDGNGYIAYARRGSLATSQIINYPGAQPRAQEVLTPVPIPVFNHHNQEPYSPHQGPIGYDYGPVGQRPHPRHRIRVPENEYARPAHGHHAEQRGWGMGQGW